MKERIKKFTVIGEQCRKGRQRGVAEKARRVNVFSTRQQSRFALDLGHVVGLNELLIKRQHVKLMRHAAVRFDQCHIGQHLGRVATCYFDEIVAPTARLADFFYSGQ